MTQIIIPMAGKGMRFSNAGYDLPKPLIEVDGITLAEHSISTLGIDGHFIFITRTFDNPEHNEMLTSIFENLCDNFTEIRIDSEHLGAAHSALYAADILNINEPLIITNCDQHLNWDGNNFMSFVKNNQFADGVVVLYESDNPKNSFALMRGHEVLAIAEKQPISNDALVGVHYWKYAGDFVYSARRAVDDYMNQGYPECYVSITYNYLIHDNKVILGYNIGGDEYQSLGTPQDIESYYEQRDW